MAPEGRKVGRLAKVAGAEPWGQMRDEKLQAVVVRSTFPKSKCTKQTHQRRTTFGSCDVEKVHGAVARSTFPSQNVQKTSVSRHFWKLTCRKSACCYCSGANHIWKSKCTKHTMLRPLLEVEMSKKCMLLWREAHFQVKMCKKHQCRATFGS